MLSLSYVAWLENFLLWIIGGYYVAYMNYEWVDDGGIGIVNETDGKVGGSQNEPVLELALVLL